MVAGKPVVFTQVDTESYTGPEPKPLEVVGAVPGGVEAQAAPVVDASPADATAVATDLQSVVDALIAAGVFTEA